MGQIEIANLSAIDRYFLSKKTRHTASPNCFPRHSLFMLSICVAGDVRELIIHT